MRRPLLLLVASSLVVSTAPTNVLTFPAIPRETVGQQRPAPALRAEPESERPLGLHSSAGAGARGHGQLRKAVAGAVVRTPTLARIDAAPLRFEANRGQMDASVRFVTRSRNYSTFLTDDAMILALPTAAASGSAEMVRLRFVGANAGTMVGEEPVAGAAHYLRGQDPAAWLIDVPAYSRIRRASLFPGIDLIYYGNGRRLEYDLHVSPGADPGAVVFNVEGGEALSLAADGDLVISTSSGDLRLAKPTVYQEVDGVRMPVAGGYRIGLDREVRFSVGAFDATRTLVIDPLSSSRPTSEALRTTSPRPLRLTASAISTLPAPLSRSTFRCRDRSRVRHRMLISSSRRSIQQAREFSTPRI